jgi:hypothetical protein
MEKIVLDEQHGGSESPWFVHLFELQVNEGHKMTSTCW